MAGAVQRARRRPDRGRIVRRLHQRRFDGAGAAPVRADAGFGTGNPAKGVASVLNASGDYAQPTPVYVASALAYATQLPNGTHQLNSGGAGPHVYNPSTYSYLLTPTAGWQTSKGAVMSGFVNYVLTLGQAKSPSFGYASLGLSLERYGIDAVTADVPGAVKVTAAEQAGYACGDLTPSEVAAGQTTPTCGVTDATAPYLRPQVWPGSAVTRPLRAVRKQQVRRVPGARTAAATALAVSVVSVVPAPECPCPDRRLWHSPVAILFRSFLLEDCCWPPDGPPVAAC